MNREQDALKEMSRNSKIINLIFEQIKQEKNKKINKN